MVPEGREYITAGEHGNKQRGGQTGSWEVTTSSQAGSRERKLEAGPSDTLSNLFFSDILPSSKAAPPEPPQTVSPTGDQVSKDLNL